MKIKRIINGIETEIELTREEMIKAAESIRERDCADYIQRHISDLENDDDRTIMWNRMSEKEREDTFDSMLFDFQELVNEHGYDWWDAWEEVSDEYLTE